MFKIILVCSLLVPPAWLASLNTPRVENGDSNMKSALINQSFKGYKVIRAVAEHQDGVNVLRGLLENPVFDFWTFPADTLVPVDIMVPPEKLEYLETTLNDNKISHTTVMDDLDNRIESTMSTDSARAPIADFTYSEYHPTPVIYRQLDEWAASYPDLVTVSSIGQSQQDKKDIKLLTIKSSTLGTQPKPAMFIDGGIHAREWISPSTVMYIAKQLLDAKNDDTTRFLLEDFDWYLVPVLNPDGYDFSHSSFLNRLWRKNRSGAVNRAEGLFGRTILDQITNTFNNGLSQTVCPGVDLNRNFGFQWREGGSSPFPCSETYHGSSAGSEAETKALSDFLMANKDSIKSYITFHSYGRLILTPWGYTRDNPETFGELARMGTFFRDAVSASAKSDGRQSSYALGTAANLLYIASGGSDDFAYGQAKIPYAYTIELPDEGTNGFLLPPNQIPIVGKDTFAGLVSYSKELSKTLTAPH